MHERLRQPKKITCWLTCLCRQAVCPRGCHSHTPSRPAELMWGLGVVINCTDIKQPLAAAQPGKEARPGGGGTQHTQQKQAGTSGHQHSSTRSRSPRCQERKRGSTSCSGSWLPHRISRLRGLVLCSTRVPAGAPTRCRPARVPHHVAAGAVSWACRVQAGGWRDLKAALGGTRLPGALGGDRAATLVRALPQPAAHCAACAPSARSVPGAPC